MRYLLPVLAAAATLAVTAGPAAAEHSDRRSARHLDSRVSLHLSRHSLVRGGKVVLHGRVRPAGRHRIKLVVRGPDAGVLAGRTGRGGAYAIRWRPKRTGPYSIRAHAVHDRRIAGGHSLRRRLTAYAPAVASYYGPGLYGGALACGGTLQPGTLGVANRTLPCGTRVKLRYRGRLLTVRVVDRGPYAAGRDFDLTEETRRRLRFPDVGVLLFSRAG